MRIGVFGGSFDPIHNAHLILGQTAREQLQLDHVRFIVANEQPDKPGKHGASPMHRLAMVQRAVEHIDGLVVDDREIQRGGVSWTADTLRSLRKEFPEAILILLMGGDTARGFPAWREPEMIRDLAQIAVCARQGEPVPPGFDFEWVVPAMDLSSQAIRMRAHAGHSLAGWVPEVVADYIGGLRLYGSSIG